MTTTSLTDEELFDIIHGLYVSRDANGLRERLKDDNFFQSLRPHLIGSYIALLFVLPELNHTQLLSLMNEDKVIETVASCNENNHPEILAIFQAFIKNSTNEDWTKRAIYWIEFYDKLAPGSNPARAKRKLQ